MVEESVKQKTTRQLIEEIDRTLAYLQKEKEWREMTKYHEHPRRKVWMPVDKLDKFRKLQKEATPT